MYICSVIKNNIVMSTNTKANIISKQLQSIIDIATQQKILIDGGFINVLPKDAIKDLKDSLTQIKNISNQ